ncbi:MAG: FAD-dependent oxidoreductase [Oscillospiraceae bacterium]|nr:FAD-dependent oxidoreductase [Oscillospiraceae bacterium]
MSKFEAFPLVGEYDTVVVGGGTAGFAAGLTAAKNGAKTLILEEKAFLGGTATGAQIGMFMGFAEGEGFAPKKGVIRDVLEGLEAEGATPGVQTIWISGRKDLEMQVIPYEYEALIRVIHRLVTASGAEVLLHTRVIGTETENGRIRTVVFHNEEGIQRVRAKTVVDASFHGSVAADAGCRSVVGDENGVLQPGSLMFYAAGVDAERYDGLPQTEKTAIAMEGVKAGVLKVNNLLARPLPNGLRYVNMTRVKVNPLDTRDWTRAEMEAREQVKSISDYFIGHVPGFAGATLSATGSFTGLRDSRRIQGCYVLKNQDVLEGRVFDDAVAKSSYPIDVHDTDGIGSTIKKPRTGVFTIPYRAMVTPEIENLILAGRCISTEYEAHASIRVMITCMRLGEASGVAAAESVKTGVPLNKIDGKTIGSRVM